jgi:hypothetical protein
MVGEHYKLLLFFLSSLLSDYLLVYLFLLTYSHTVSGGRYTANISSGTIEYQPPFVFPHIVNSKTKCYNTVILKRKNQKEIVISAGETLHIRGQAHHNSAGRFVFAGVLQTVTKSLRDKRYPKIETRHVM